MSGRKYSMKSDEVHFGYIVALQQSPFLVSGSHVYSFG